MLALRLLGNLDLRAADGSPLPSVLGLPKPFALLAYLASGRPTGFHTRDALVALLWPECSQEHARAALRQSVYTLRRALGEDVLAHGGDYMLGVDPTKLWCDAAALDVAAASGDDGRVLELYQGDFLEGFHLSGTPGFERWAERVRSRLRGAAAAAAWRLADSDEAGGQLARALRWIELLLAMSPDDERALQRALALLQRLGDRPAAIRLYEQFARGLEEDYDLEPSAETRSLIAALRRDPTNGRSGPLGP